MAPDLQIKVKLCKSVIDKTRLREVIFDMDCGLLDEESIYLKNDFTHLSKVCHVVPKRDERDAKKKSQGASEFRHQRCYWVDQLFCPYGRLI